MTVICENEECTEYQILKTGADFPIEDVRCGKCGGPVTEAEEVTEDG
jgi:hypothetical protein